MIRNNLAIGIATSLVLTCLSGPAICAAKQGTVGTIPRVQLMPHSPTPYQMRDWTKASRDYLNLVLDSQRTGQYLPFVHLSGSNPGTFSLPSYVGLTDGAEGINCIAVVVSGGLVGVDMTRYKGQNWVAMSQAYFNPLDKVFTNNVGSRAGSSFWYDLFPNILAAQVVALNPSASGGNSLLQQSAEQWYQACVAMGGKTNPTTLPNFDHTAFRFDTMMPVDNNTWIEPDGAAGIAWLDYLAWTQHKDPHLLTAADWCLRAMEQRPQEKNPLYEVLLPYGAFIAARINAEQGTTYDVQKLLNWCFEPGDSTSARVGWGVIADRFGADDCYGLAGSVTDTSGYAFTMNTFEWAGAITPIARYDSRYAPSIGRWMLNLANAARLFYPNGLSADHQDDRAWADKYDPNYAMAYEGLRKQARRYETPVADESTARGQITSGSYLQTQRWDDQVEVLTETAQNGQFGLQHIWRLNLPAGANYDLLLRARRGPNAPAGKAFAISYATMLAGPYSSAFTVTADDLQVYYTGITAGAGPLYIKAESAAQSATAGSLQVDFLRSGIVSPDLSPFATGDAEGNGNPSNLCLYGASHIGILGALVAPTPVPQILQLNLLATDYFHDKAYPTYLYYNPYNTPKTVSLALGTGPKDLYDAFQHRFVARKVQNSTSVTIPANSAMVLVLAPAGGTVTQQQHKRLINGVVVDYRAQ